MNSHNEKSGAEPVMTLDSIALAHVQLPVLQQNDPGSKNGEVREKPRMGKQDGSITGDSTFVREEMKQTEEKTLGKADPPCMLTEYHKCYKLENKSFLNILYFVHPL